MEFDILGEKMSRLHFSPSDVIKLLDKCLTKVRADMYTSSFVKMVKFKGEEYFTACSDTDPKRVKMSETEKIICQKCLFKPLNAMDIYRGLVIYFFYHLLWILYSTW